MVNIRTQNCVQENIKNPFQLFTFITNTNQIYKNITIRI